MGRLWSGRWNRWERRKVWVGERRVYGNETCVSPLQTNHILDPLRHLRL